MDNNNEQLLINLMIACGEGDIENVKKYIKLGANVNNENDSFPPLKIAIENQQYQVIAILLENGAKIGNSIYNLVDSAADSYHNGLEDLTVYVQIIKLLLDYGANIEDLSSDYPFEQIVINKILKCLGQAEKYNL